MPQPSGEHDANVIFNGINGQSGDYLFAGTSVKQLAQWASKDRALIRNDADTSSRARHLRDLMVKSLQSRLQGYGPRYGIDGKKLDEAGWGVLFPQKLDVRIVQALRPLLALRQDQAGRLYREFVDEAGYRTGESKRDFVARHKMGAGPADPEKLPYYLLIVGDPESIPYEFQYQLDVQYAVGRLWFGSDDNAIDKYRSYADSVVNAEAGRTTRSRTMVFFGPENNGDQATRLSARHLLQPLAGMANSRGAAVGWAVDTTIGKGATKAALERYFNGEHRPAFLFTASHGLGFSSNQGLQRSDQGALICQDWSGPGSGALSPDCYFGGRDMAGANDVAGLISFHFACYGAGTPKFDDFAHQTGRGPTQIAPVAFLANLPCEMLGHSAGGALAVVGHVERAWGCSIVSQADVQQIQGFEDAVKSLMDGTPVGFALESMNQRYADLSSDLSAELLRNGGRPPTNDYEFLYRWTENNDARAFVILGDPAVRLAVGAPREALRASRTSSISTGGTAAPSFPGAGAPASERKPNNKEPGEHMAADNSDSQAGRMKHTFTIPLEVTISIAVGGQTQKVSVDAGGTQSQAGGTGQEFAVQIDPDYGNREGYDAEFLGGGSRIPLPGLSTAQAADAAVVPGATAAERHELKYHHYSVVLNMRRRLAFFTAVNINGKLAGKPKREPDRWSYDPRVAREMQLGEDLYTSNPFDRGHLVRRLDPAWGRSEALIKRANDDTFHFTNCSPQHERFNQGKNLWAGLEDYLLGKASGEEKKMTVFTGPVFSDSDPLYRGVRIPKQYWKVAVIIRANGKPAALGFVVSQEKFLRNLAAFSAEDVADTYQVPIKRIAEITDLDFGSLVAADAGEVASFGMDEGQKQQSLKSYEDIQLRGFKAQGAESTMGFTVSGGAAVSGTEPVPGTDLSYFLVSFDSAGRERLDHPAGRISDLAAEAVRGPGVTDVFLFSHGWQGDVPAAREQYAGWIRAMDGCKDDIVNAQHRPGGFKPVLVGVHWPSLAWGDERLDLVPFGVVFDGVGSDVKSENQTILESYAARLSDTPAELARIWEPLKNVLDEIAKANSNEEQLPTGLAEAYRKLDEAMGRVRGIEDDPGADATSFDPMEAFKTARESSQRTDFPQGGAIAFGGGYLKNLFLTPLRMLSYWKMKNRARSIGEGGIRDLLVRLQKEAEINPSIRFHLMGHSFGCIVVSSALRGANSPVKPVASLSLLQGALSLWAYCDDITLYAPGTPGYFHPLISLKKVSGPIVTTRSIHDSAVGTMYPLASRIHGSVVFNSLGTQLPKYGALGAFGAQGLGTIAQDLQMRDTVGQYNLKGGPKVFNVEASQYICIKSGMSGAHNDIRKPEVAHLVWSAVLAL